MATDLKNQDTNLKISYQSKEVYVCPVCEEEFRREELLSGGGRLNAGELTDELHRLYVPSARYGSIYPLVYQATVCHNCWFSSLASDFNKLPKDKIDKVAADENKRREEAELIYPGIDFRKPRTLESGIVSQYLVMRCYDYYKKDSSPTIKQAVTALRTGWLLEELDKKEQGRHYDWLAVLLKKKAGFFYLEALKREQKGTETLSGMSNLGPDTDKNYGYEGMIYIAGLLQYKYGDTNNPDLRRATLGEVKRNLAKIFGLGRSSKNKPGALLEKSRVLYDTITKELNEFD
ncbi:MAG: DUF2225 domain-containing protein [Spirochaetaceae bacterium]|jgi:uncharacterized protein (DUF2225 family)|nr:DUF2225 domain-containing protein [Spirochaetaceae bacterium]